MPVLEAISTYLDIVDLIPQLFDDEAKEFNVLDPQQIRAFILRNDSQLRGQLELHYGTDLTETPRVDQPAPPSPIYNQGAGTLLLQDATGANKLTVLEASELLFSQVYRLEFTSDTAFDVESELTGDQGSGTKSASFTTTDTFLTIPSQLWNGVFAKEDVHYIRVHNYPGMIVHLSALLAATNILDTIFTEEVPDASATSQRYTRLYDRLVRALQQGIITIPGKAMVARDLDPVQVDYEVDEYGRDITDYRDLEWPAAKGDLV